jgi:Zn-dependent oligopeptidase
MHTNTYTLILHFFPQYLSVDNVLAGLTSLSETLFQLRLTLAPTTTDTWHPTVRKVMVTRLRGSNESHATSLANEGEGEEMVGTIYLDLFDRPHKPHTACQFMVQCAVAPLNQLPIAVLVILLWVVSPIGSGFESAHTHPML